MPTITFNLNDLNNLVGKDIKPDEVDDLVSYGKGEFEEYDRETGELTVSFGDTNMPYLWSIEGVSILLKGVLGIENGIPRIDVKNSDEEVIVDPTLKEIRPHIAAFRAEGQQVDDYLIKQIIQLQEKLCESYGRRRLKIAIGIYTHKKIKFPVHYKAIDPEGLEFTPLTFKRPMTPEEILESHPTGKKYAWILEGQDKYPLLIDSDNNVLSFPPIINSDDLGKIEIGDNDLFIEVTGTDLTAVNLCANILATAFDQRGFNIHSCTIKYEDRSLKTPDMKTENIIITKEQIHSLFGVDLEYDQVKKYAEMARYNAQTTEHGIQIEIPHYRGDILHPVDIIEDIGIMHGFENFPDTLLTEYTSGGTDELTEFTDRARSILAGFGLQEILSPVLSNKKDLYETMNIEDFGTIEIKEYMSQTYSVVRTWLTPILLKVLSMNKHNDYPQAIFEAGTCVTRKAEEIYQFERMAACLCDGTADFTKAKQILDRMITGLGAECTMEETEHRSFIPGRVARVNVNGKAIAYVGEIHPEVLMNLGIEMPVACFELNLSDLFSVINKLKNQD